MTYFIIALILIMIGILYAIYYEVKVEGDHRHKQYMRLLNEHYALQHKYDKLKYDTRFYEIDPKLYPRERRN